MCAVKNFQAEETEEGEEEVNRDIVRSVVKAFSILESFTDLHKEATVSEIAAETGLGRAVVYRMAMTLEHIGYLERCRDGKSYRLSLKCLNIGMNALAGQDVRSLASPRLRDLVPRYADAASLAVLDGADVVYIDRVEQGLDRTGLVRRIGSRIPVYGAAVGFALLAFMPRERQIEILGSQPRHKLSERTVTDLDELLAILAETNQRGYATSDQQNAFGLRTIAAPVLDHTKTAVAAISVTIRAERLDMEAFQALSRDKVVGTACEISQAMCALAEMQGKR